MNGPEAVEIYQPADGKNRGNHKPRRVQDGGRVARSPGLPGTGCPLGHHTGSIRDAAATAYAVWA